MSIRIPLQIPAPPPLAKIPNKSPVTHTTLFPSHLLCFVDLTCSSSRAQLSERTQCRLTFNLSSDAAAAAGTGNSLGQGSSCVNRQRIEFVWPIVFNMVLVTALSDWDCCGYCCWMMMVGLWQEDDRGPNRVLLGQRLYVRCRKGWLLNKSEREIVCQPSWVTMWTIKLSEAAIKEN